MVRILCSGVLYKEEESLRGTFRPQTLRSALSWAWEYGMRSGALSPPAGGTIALSGQARGPGLVGAGERRWESK